MLPLLVFCAGCRQDMFDQPKYRPLAESSFYADGRSARPIPAGTLTYNGTDRGETVENGTTNGVFAASIPVPVDETLLQRGRDRFDIYCSPCHGRVGDGHGMIAKRGFMQPADLHSDRVRKAPPGYLYDVIAHGYGAMPDYGDELSVEDRWAVVAYIRALELSRHANVQDVPPDQVPALEKAR
jgi:mono/diheme cytochrome c family protein